MKKYLDDFAKKAKKIFRKHGLRNIVIFLLSWLLNGPWKDPTTYYEQSAPIVVADQFAAIIPGTRLHIGFVIAIISAILLYLLIKKTPLGYE